MGFLRLVLELAVTSNALYCAGALLLAHHAPLLGFPLMRTCAVGFSGVLFGLKARLCCWLHHRPAATSPLQGSGEGGRRGLTARFAFPRIVSSSTGPLNSADWWQGTSISCSMAALPCCWGPSGVGTPEGSHQVGAAAMQLTSIKQL